MTKEERELNDILVKGLVAREVMDPMQKIGWGHSTPPAPDYGTTPKTEGAPGQPVKQTQPQDGLPAPKAGEAPTDGPKAGGDPTTDLVALYESLRDPDSGLIMKKYKTVPDAIKGSSHLAQMAKQAFTVAEQANIELAKRTAENESFRQNLHTDPNRGGSSGPSQHGTESRLSLDAAKAKLERVLTSITENGGVLSPEIARDLSNVQLEVAEAAATHRLQEVQSSQKLQEEQDRNEWRQVDAYMADKHPAAARFAEEVALYMQSDPLLMKAVNALLAAKDRTAATELAWLSFEKAHGEQVASDTRTKAEEKETDLAAREQVRQEQVAKARKDAGVVTGSAGGSGIHENSGAGGGSREEIIAAREQMAHEGDGPGSASGQAFRRMVIPLDPAIFGPMR